MNPSILRRIWRRFIWLLTLPVLLPVYLLLCVVRWRRSTVLPQHDGAGSIIQADKPKQVPAALEPGDDDLNYQVHRLRYPKPDDDIDTSKVKWYADPINTLGTLHIERILRGVKRGYWSTSDKPATASTKQRMALEQELQHRLKGELHE